MPRGRYETAIQLRLLRETQIKPNKNISQDSRRFLESHCRLSSLKVGAFTPTSVTINPHYNYNLFITYLFKIYISLLNT